MLGKECCAATLDTLELDIVGCAVRNDDTLPSAVTNTGVLRPKKTHTVFSGLPTRKRFNVVEGYTLVANVASWLRCWHTKGEGLLPTNSPCAASLWMYNNN